MRTSYARELAAVQRRRLPRIRVGLSVGWWQSAPATRPPRSRYGPRLLTRSDCANHDPRIPVSGSDSMRGQQMENQPSPLSHASADPTLAILLPTYNATSHLSNTLASLALQAGTEQWLETIVIDNNSTDGRLERLHREFSGRLNLTLVLQPKLQHTFALARARNLGMRLTRAEWILLLDADCIPAPGLLAATRALIRNSEGTRLIATGERIFIDSLPLGEITTSDDLAGLASLPRVASTSNYGLKVDRRLPAMRDLPNCPHPWAYMHGGVLLYRKTDAVQVDGFDETYDGNWGYEDADFAYRMISRASCTPVYHQSITVFHQEDPIGDSKRGHKWEKRANPNWRHICATIPGFEAFKRAQWRSLGIDVAL